MNQQSFQDEVIDRLARIETKQDATNGRVTKLEGEVDSLQQTRSEGRGAVRLIAGAAGLGGGIIGFLLNRLFPH